MTDTKESSTATNAEEQARAKRKEIERKGGLIGITHDREGNALPWTVIGGVGFDDPDDNEALDEHIIDRCPGFGHVCDGSCRLTEAERESLEVEYTNDPDEDDVVMAVSEGDNIRYALAGDLGPNGNGSRAEKSAVRLRAGDLKGKWMLSRHGETEVTHFTEGQEESVFVDLGKAILFVAEI